VHGSVTWPVCWFFGTFLLYQATFILLFADRLNQLFKSKTTALDSSDVDVRA
jgi:hypothetical protein